MWGVIRTEGMVSTQALMSLSSKGSKLTTRLIRAVGAVAVMAAALALAPGTGVHASPPFCGTISDPYSHSQADLAACGVRTFPRQNTTNLPDGGTEYTYTVDGRQVDFRVPPSGFDANRADASTLAFYHIPPRPEGGEALTRWQSAASKMHFVTPPPFLAAVPGVSAALAAGTGTTYYNWSGYEATASYSRYTDADMTYIEPSALSTTCTNNGEVTWAGLGGDGVSQLGQIGTAINVPGLSQHQGWYEVLPDDPSIIALNITGHNGYTVEASVTFSVGPPYEFYLYDGWSGATTSFTVTTGSYAGNTADFIAERPTYGTYPNQYYATLTDFSYLSVSNALVSDLSTTNSVGTFPNKSLPMSSKETGDPLAAVSGLTNGRSFQVTWKNCG